MADAILVFPIIFWLIQGITCSQCQGVEEPCYLSNNIEMPYLDTRNPVTLLTAETVQNKYCDLYAVDPDTWYRSEYEMTTQVVQQGTCGANEPIWLNGTIPEVADGIVSREACVRSFLGPCVTTYTVNIKQCQYYTVYCFPGIPTGCHQRYCFDVNITKTTTTSTTSTTVASTSPSINNCLDAKLDDKSNNNYVIKAVAFTLVVSLIVFGAVLAIVVYLLRRKVFPEDKYQISPGNGKMYRECCPTIVTVKCLPMVDSEGKVKETMGIKC